MDPETEEIIKEQMKILPIEVKRLLADPGLNNKILDIGRKNGLNGEQLPILQLETNLVMLGLTPLEEYGSELKDRLKVDDIKADNIANDINKEILRGIREGLNAISDVTDQSLTSERPGTESSWIENLNFILPDDDYSDLTDPIAGDTEISDADNGHRGKISGYTPEATSKVGDIKNNFLYNDKNE